MEDTTRTTTQSSFSLVSASISSRYEGLIDISYTSKIKNAFVSLFSYFDDFGPMIPILYSIVGFFRLAQLFGPSLLAHNPYIWTTSNTAGGGLSIISVFYHFCPVQYRESAHTVLLIIYSVISVLYLLYLLITALIYKESTKVPKASTYILCILVAILNYLLHPAAVQYIGEAIACMIRDNIIDVDKIIAMIIAVIVLCVSIYVTISIYTFSLSFRLSSLQTIEQNPQNMLFLITLLITFVTAISWNKITFYVTSVIAMLCYVYIIFNVLTKCSYPRELHMMFVVGVCISSLLNFVLRFITVAMGIDGNDVIFVISIVLLVIGILIASFIVRKITIKYLLLLDEIEANVHEFEYSSITQFKNLIRVGYLSGHQLVLSFELQKLALETWPDNFPIIMLMSKFSAIYPENSQSLVLLSRKLPKNTSLTGRVEALRIDISSVLKMRETTLTPDLKKHLAKISKLNSKAKNKLRNIWDLILQSNINDMEASIHSSYKAVDDLQSELNHLSSNYPNNRFVARYVLRFYKEVMADQENYQVWQKNLQELQRGHQIAVDRTHELGMLAFPNLPATNDDLSRESLNFATDTESEEFYTMDENQNDSTDVLAKAIENYKSPGLRAIYLGTIVLFLVFFVVPILVLLIYFFFYINVLTEPLSIMYYISYSRSLLNLCTSFTLFFAITNVDDGNGQPIMEALTLPDDFPMDAFGGFRTRVEMTKYMLKTLVEATPNVLTLNDFKLGDEYVDDARSFMNDQITEFAFYTTETNGNIQRSDVKDSATNIPSRVANQMSQILEDDTIVEDDITTPTFLMSINNNVPSSRMMNNAMENLTSYIINMNSDNQTIFLVVMVVLIIVVIIAYGAAFFIQMKILKQNKIQIFKIFTVLPKSVISTIAASFYSVEKKSHSESSMESFDINKQEENITKIFASLSDDNGKASSDFLFGAVTFLLIVCDCIAIYLNCNSYQTTSSILNNNAPHIDYLFGTSTTMGSMMATIFRLAFYGWSEEYHIIIDDLESEKTSLGNSLSDCVEFWDMMRFGGHVPSESPYSGLQDALDRSSELIECVDESQLSEEFFDIISCMTAEQDLYTFLCVVKDVNVSLIVDGLFPDPKAERLPRLFKLGPVMLYEAFFYLTANDIVRLISQTIRNERTPVITQSIAFLIVGLCLVVIELLLGKVEERYIIFTLKLFFHCPVSDVVHSSAIMNFLGGSSQLKQNESTERNDHFFQDVMNKLTDAVIVAKGENGIIETVNEAFTKLFEIPPEDILGTNIEDFFTKKRFTGDFEEGMCPRDVVAYRSDHGDRYFQFASTIVHTNKIITAVDNTRRINHQKLIDDEKKKSDTLLASILPPSLVPRVQNGETNISFSVQSVSVLFLDVVSFTPWCGSHDAQYVMKMLNIMFKEFDQLVASHSTLTRVKCIGDCYMAAGGIFDEVNQPALHSKEMVTFGIETIHKIVEINQLHNETLRVRVGINTGGPIVAGVLGTEKPTFEILGPAINIAQQMEHNGVAMMVHISRTVYELIYGSAFNIKERGEIETKKGKMMTYLVDPNLSNTNNQAPSN